MWQFACSMCGGHRGQDHAQRYCQAKILALTSPHNEDEPSLAQADAGDHSYPCDSLWEVPKVRAAARF